MSRSGSTSPTPDPTMRHRRGALTLTVLDAAGAPLSGREVVVEQRRHDVGFGNIGFEFIPLANDELPDVRTAGPDGSGPLVLGAEEGTRLTRPESQHLADLWLELFNTATLPFYWGRFEPVRGRPDTQRLLRTARWFAERGVHLKGHPLVWHTVTAPWLLDLSTAEVEWVQRERIRRDVADFAGLVDTWDAINEAVIMPVFDKEDNGITRLCRDIGRIATVRLAFEEARATNPSATLLLNDFDMSSGYECLIEGVLEAGIQVDVLGLQTHMHQGYWGEERTLGVLERFSRYGLPIHMTESTIVSGTLMPPELRDLNDYQVSEWPSTPEGEERQADEVSRHYRTLLSHPSVQSVTYWGLSDVDSWLGAPVGFVRKDGTTKPSYDALHGLIKGEWWLAPTPMRTDEAGRVQVEGWFGDYRVSAAGDAGAFRIEPDGMGAEVRLG